MLNDFIGGGQIFLHKIRMFMQVLDRSMIVSLLVGGALAYPKLWEYDWRAAMTYQKAYVAESISDGMKDIRKAVNPGAKRHITKVDAYDKKGLFGRDIEAVRILRNYHFKTAYNSVGAFIWSTFLATSIVFGINLILVFMIWSKYGAGAKAKRHIKGHTIKNSAEVLSYLRRSKKASDIKVGEMPLVKDFETKHIMITGTTGSGKTNCLHNILLQIRSKKQRAIILDTEGDMVARYFRPGKDILINPFDLRTVNWDLWSEIESIRSIKKIATSFFPDSPPDSNDYDSKWTSWGKMLFTGIVEHLYKSKEPTIEELYNLIHREPIESLTKKLRDTSAGSLLSSKSENNAAPHNIRINTVVATEWLEFLSDKKENRFSFRQWFKGFDESNDDGWIFICCDGGDAKILLPFFSVLMDIAINSLISLGINRDRRMWFIMDELAKLKYLPALQENITLLRKYGGCVMVATQSFNQILSTYGRTTGSVMLAQFNTNIIFRSKLDEARLIAKQIGEIECLNFQKNISFGANDFRDGVSYTEQEKKQDLVTAGDIENLKEHEAYIMLPEAEVAIAKVQLKISKCSNNLQAPFKENPEIGEMLAERQKRWNERSQLEVGKAQVKKMNIKKKVKSHNQQNATMENENLKVQRLSPEQEKILEELGIEDMLDKGFAEIEKENL